MPEHYDVFLSYAKADAAQVHRLAENLHQAGLEVFLDEWEIAPGDVLVHQLDRGLQHAANGILAVTPASLSRPWVLEEYAAMLTRAVAGKQRLIPVLLADAEMPPLLASRVWVDLRRADGPEYDREIQKLVSFLKGKRPGPPPRTGELLPRPDTAFRAEGVISRRLQIGEERVALLDGETVEAEHQPKGLSYRTRHQLLWDLDRLRHGRLPEDAQLYRAAGTAEAPAQGSKQHALLLEVGAALGEELLAGAAGEALGRVLGEANLGAPLELALEPEDGMADLPWETLRLPGADAGHGHPRSSAHPGGHRQPRGAERPRRAARHGRGAVAHPQRRRARPPAEPARLRPRTRAGTVQAIQEALEAERAPGLRHVPAISVESSGR